MKDIVRGADMYNGNNAFYTNDRFGSPNSAISLIDGYYEAPAGVYFKGDLTISVWIRLRVQVTWAKIVDFGNGDGVENVLVSASYQAGGFPAPEIFNINIGQTLITSKPLTIGAWTHLVFTLSGTHGSFYMNGTLTASQNNINVPNNVIRSPNYIGKSHWAADGNLNADLDDLRFYNRSITPSEILKLWSFFPTTTTTTTKSTTTTSTTQTTSATTTTTQITSTTSSTTTSYSLSYIFQTMNSTFELFQLKPTLLIELLISKYDLGGCLVNCTNNGQCKYISANDKIICSCFLKYMSGYACQIDTRPCSSNPCLNNATCIDFSNSRDYNVSSLLSNNSSSFYCLCDIYYSGTHCESKIDVCQNETCSNNGNCIDLDHLPKCKCVSMFLGEKCEIESSELKTVKKIISFTSILAIIILALFFVVFILMDISKYYFKCSNKKRRLNAFERQKLKKLIYHT